MESKVSNVLKIILGKVDDSFLEDSTTSDYLSKIGNYTFEQILSEPLCLNDETKTLTDQTQELALANYRAFVETAEYSDRIIKDFDKSKEKLGAVLEKTPKFITECEHFSTVSKEILRERGFNDQIKYQSEHLLGILELPTLMQTALNNSDYDSALDLFAYIRNLSRKYKNLTAIQTIASEVTKLWFETLYHLFNQLRYDLPLPQCLQILGYLRRANVVYESTMEDPNVLLQDFEYNSKTNSNKLRNVSEGLQLHFLKARGNWFDTALEEAINDNDDKYLRKIVELHRIHLFNILTQHKAIFLSDTQNSKLKGDDLNGISALSSWLKEKVHRLTTILEQNASQEVDASFESLINQCMYLCLSFGRVGADMRGIIGPLFRNIISNEFKKAMLKADGYFESEMKQYKIQNQSKLSKKNVSDADQNQNNPPESLLEFYPLAEYCNNILCALNTMRVTAPLCLAQEVLEGISNSLRNVAKNLLAFYNRENQTFTETEREQFTLYCNIFINELIPYMQKSINQIFPPASIAEQLGISIAAFQESNLMTLDSKISDVLSNVITVEA